MKAISALFIVAVATLALAGGSSTNQNTPLLPTGTAVGRFQLLNAVVEVNSEKESVLFKIDTVTGETWRYDQVRFKTTNGVPVGCYGWSSIGNYDENFNRLKDALK